MLMADDRPLTGAPGRCRGTATQREWLTSAIITAYPPRIDADSGSQVPNNRGFPVQNP
jgi:hypothetical protein